MVHFSELSNKEVIYSHIDFETKQATHYAITRLKNDPQFIHHHVENVTIDKDHALFCLEYRGIEKHRLFPLLMEPIREPIVVAITDDETHLILDGNHRYVAAAMRNLRSIQAKILPMRICEQHIIEGFPEVDADGLLTMFSGIPA